jgi:hypothetical protein
MGTGYFSRVDGGPGQHGATKSSLSPFSAGVLFSLLACTGAGFTAQVKGEAVIAAGSPDAGLGALPPLSSLSSVDFDTNSDFKALMVTRETTTLARVDGASAEVLTSGQDVTFLDELQLIARTGTNETLFAQASGIASLAGKTELRLDIVNGSNDITPQVKTNPMSFVMRGKGRRPPVDTRVQVTVVLHVEASR